MPPFDNNIDVHQVPRTIIRGLLVQLSQEKIENLTLVTYCGRSFFCLFVLYIKKNVEVNGSECHSAVRKDHLTVASIFLLFVLICFSFFFIFIFLEKKSHFSQVSAATKVPKRLEMSECSDLQGGTGVRPFDSPMSSLQWTDRH